MKRQFVSILAIMAMAPVTLAQDPLIERAKRQQMLADQRAESDTRDALAAAENLSRSHPDKAIRDLKKIVNDLDLRTDISSKKRADLVTLVSQRISALELAGRNPTRDPQPRQVDPKVLARNAENRKKAEKFELEAKEVQAAITAIRLDVENNRDREATQKIADLTRKYPDNPAMIYLGSGGSVRDRLAVAADLAQEQQDRFVLAMRDVDHSALPAKGDIEFPKGWKEKMERRAKLLKQDLYGPEEMKILETLEKPVDLKLKGTPFEESLQSMSTALDLPIFIDKKAIEDQAIDLKAPVNVPGGLTARSTLRAMLNSVGLTFIIKDKTLQVVSIEKARMNYVTRAYDVSDLVRTGGPFNSPVVWGPFLDHQQTIANAQILQDMIMKSIDPMVWQQNQASITFHYPSMSIIIRAPSEVHATLGKSLNR